MGRYCIISDETKAAAEGGIEELKAAVFVHLFYEERMAFYREYLNRIPSFIDIVIISSKDTILDSFDNHYIKIKKQNRGRDISALLVAARELIFSYDYICFIHDKKEKGPDIKENTDLWVKNLWDNMLQSQTYIYNVLELMSRKQELGMLVPLPPYGRDFGVWLKGGWGPNYDNVKELVDELGLRVNICRERSPISYSTVFWAKSEALRKLFSRSWNYTDFPDEPMKNDGEINHAIERILQYVAEDAGYDTRISLSTSFVEYFIEQLSSDINDLWKQLDLTMGIKNYSELDNFHARIEKMKKFAKEYADIYLYGSGQAGRNCLKICRILDMIPKGFIVTNPSNGPAEIEGIPVIGIADYVPSREAGIIISVGAGYQTEIEAELIRRKIESYVFF